jgi:hypothetical protein
MDIVTLGMAKADAAKRYASNARLADIARNALPVPFCSRQSVPMAASGGLSNGTDTSATYRRRHTALMTASNLILEFPNYYNNNGDETDTPNSITIRASIEYKTGQFQPIFFQGKRSVVVEPGASIACDPLGIQIKSGDQFHTLTYVEVTAGQKWPLSNTAVATDTEGVTIGSDLTMTGGVTATNVRTYGPSAIVGTVAEAVPSVSIGPADSIGAGYDDAGDVGFIARALIADGIGYLNLGMGSDAPGKWTLNEKRRRRAPLLRYCNYAVIEIGTNGIQSPTTMDTVAANQIAVWKFVAEQGIKGYQTTLLPRSTSTDGFATTANQTTDPARQANRVAFNGWIRDGAPINTDTGLWAAAGSSGASIVRSGDVGHPLAGWFECADAVETARDSGIWKATGSTTGRYTDDGTHPSSDATTVLIPTIDTSVFVPR